MRRFIILLDFHFSLGTYLPMKRIKHKNKIMQNSAQIFTLVLKKYKWGLVGRKLVFKKEPIPIKTKLIRAKVRRAPSYL